MKCQSLFSGKSMRKYFKMSFLPSILSVKCALVRQTFYYKFFPQEIEVWSEMHVKMTQINYSVRFAL